MLGNLRNLIFVCFLALPVLAQTPADLYVLEAYQAWLAAQPAAVQNSADVLDAYKAYLVERSADSVDAESQIRVIRASAQPGDFLAEMAAGRKPGKALQVGTMSVRLAEKGWDVTVRKPGPFDFGKNRWDLIALTGADFRSAAAKIAAALRPGGLLVIDGTSPDVAKLFPGLRVRALRGSAVVQFCAERPAE